jgi:predicted DNA-binding transcriptional regulator AlpA
MNTLLTKGEVCLLFGRINSSTLYRQIKKGLIPPPIKVGGSSRWLKSECQAALEQMVEARS